MLATVFIWALALATYLLLAGEVSAAEVTAGMICGGLVALWSRCVRAASPHRFRFEAAALLAIGRAIAGFPSGVAKVGAGLGRSLAAPEHGTTLRRNFAHGPRGEPRDAARRAVVVLASSLAPDTYVLRTPDQRDEIDIHTLTGTKPRDDARWPI